jgi:predicted TPR repeat methyltransferase
LARPTLTPTEALQRAERLARRGRSSEAKSLLAAILGRDPRNKKARKLLRTLEGDTAAALSEADFRRVDDLMRRGHWDTAAADVRHLCRAHPDQPALHNLRGVIAARRGDRERAEQAFRTAVQLAPDFDDALHNLASTLTSSERFREAVGVYQELLNRGSGDAELYRGLARALTGAGSHDDALEALRRALLLRPLYPDALADLGELYLARGRPREAADSFRRALDIQPQHPRSRRGALAARQATAGMSAAEQASEREPGEADAGDAGATETLYRELPALLERVDGEDAWYEHALDLGCGAGLAGLQVRSYCGQLLGVEGSPAMLARARETAVYNDLVEAPPADWVTRSERLFDLALWLRAPLQAAALTPLLERLPTCLADGARVAVAVSSRGDQSGEAPDGDAAAAASAAAAGFAILARYTPADAEPSEAMSLLVLTRSAMD